MTDFKLYDITLKVTDQTENSSKGVWQETYERTSLNPLKKTLEAKNYCFQTISNYNASLKPQETARRFVGLVSVIETKTETETEDTFECVYCAYEISGKGNYPQSDFCQDCIDHGEHEQE